MCWRYASGFRWGIEMRDGTSGISAEEWELLSFFEVEPILQDQDAPWVYNDACYAIQRSDHSLSVSISPSYRDVRLILKHGDSRLYELNSMGIHDVRYIKESSDEFLVFELNSNESLRLRVKPTIELTHSIDDRAGPE